MKLLLLSVLLPSLIIAQSARSPKKYANTITATDLKTHLYIIAGAEMEGRETATDGERRAAAYIANHFSELGLKPGNKGNFLMPFPLSAIHLSILLYRSTEKTSSTAPIFHRVIEPITVHFFLAKRYCWIPQLLIQF